MSLYVAVAVTNAERLISETRLYPIFANHGSTNGTSGCQVQAKCSIIIIFFCFGIGVGATYHVTYDI